MKKENLIFNPKGVYVVLKEVNCTNTTRLSFRVLERKTINLHGDAIHSTDTLIIHETSKFSSGTRIYVGRILEEKEDRFFVYTNERIDSDFISKKYGFQKVMGRIKADTDNFTQEFTMTFKELKLLFNKCK